MLAPLARRWRILRNNSDTPATIPGTPVPLDPGDLAAVDADLLDQWPGTTGVEVDPNLSALTIRPPATGVNAPASTAPTPTGTTVP